MKAEYDSEADALSILFAEGVHAVRGERVHPRAIVDMSADGPLGVQLLYPGRGIEEPLAAAASEFGLDREALEAAARSALSAPDREVSLDVANTASPDGT